MDTPGAWVYPGPPADGAQAAYRARGLGGWGHLRVQYLTLVADGTLERLDEATYGENGYSPANAADVRAHARAAWVTVAAQHAAAAVLLAPTAEGHVLREAARATIVSLVNACDFCGAELDVEGAWRFTPGQFDAYVAWSDALAADLHAAGRLLAVTVPPVPPDHRVWRNAAWGAGHSCDYVTVMAYDAQYDTPGSGIAPLAFVRRVVGELAQALGPDAARAKLVAGLPAYAYSCRAARTHNDDDGDDMDVRVLTVRQALAQAADGDPRRLATAPLDAASAETVLHHHSGRVFFLSTPASVQAKTRAAYEAGARRFCYWHLGGDNPVPGTDARLP
jgi:spore germination protein YaaH